MSDQVSQQETVRPRLDKRLLALNGGLLVVLGVVTLANVRAADAQPTTTPNRARGEYTMVSGRMQGSTAAVLYLIDATNQEIVAASWDRNNNKLEPVGLRSLSDDSRYLQRPR